MPVSADPGLTTGWPERAARARLHYVSGKGGTGKSTVAGGPARGPPGGGGRGDGGSEWGGGSDTDRAGTHGRRGGLGLDIRDDYTGAIRPAKTLSGGEGVTDTLHHLGTSGPSSFVLAYETYRIPDQIEEFYQGGLVHNTGYIGDDGSRERSHRCRHP
ncbi:hypothetical protein, partial [Nocardia cyriacigeorgica]|uniref:hypothetical protein n=1 Tax=Nocardia cyriacigeorgica TaxID=135487 RepID=UPI0024569C38